MEFVVNVSATNLCWRKCRLERSTQQSAAQNVYSTAHIVSQTLWTTHYLNHSEMMEFTIAKMNVLRIHAIVLPYDESFTRVRNLYLTFFIYFFHTKQCIWIWCWAKFTSLLFSLFLKFMFWRLQCRREEKSTKY